VTLSGKDFNNASEIKKIIFKSGSLKLLASTVLFVLVKNSGCPLLLTLISSLQQC
jgi:hypothetical protein